MWLLIAAADVGGCVFARIWALVPVRVEASAVLDDEDRVFGLAVGEISLQGHERKHPADLAREVSHLLQYLGPPRGATQPGS